MSRARDLADGTFSGAFSADSPTLVVDDANNRVGVGTASPSEVLEVRKDAASTYGTKIKITNGANFGYGAAIDFDMPLSSGGAVQTAARIGGGYAGVDDGFLGFYTTLNSTLSEAARIASDGAFFIGKTTAGIANPGFEFKSNAQLYLTRDGGTPVVIRRSTNDGNILSFYKDGTEVGAIAAQSGVFVLKGNANSTNGPLINIQNSTGGTCLTLGVHATSYGYIGDQSGSQVGIAFVSGAVKPVASSNGSVADNSYDFGTATARWDDIYATNGTIQTSDANEKQDVAELDEAEKRVATAAKGLIRKFRWISSVEEKGDDARIHVGVIAQDLKAAFEAEGLDPGRYAMFIRSTWWEADETYTDDEGVEQTRTNTYETAEEAPENAVERTRLGVRYNQLLAFIIGAM